MKAPPARSSLSTYIKPPAMCCSSDPFSDKEMTYSPAGAFRSSLDVRLMRQHDESALFARITVKTTLNHTRVVATRILLPPTLGRYHIDDTGKTFGVLIRPLGNPREHHHQHYSCWNDKTQPKKHFRYPVYTPKGSDTLEHFIPLPTLPHHIKIENDFITCCFCCWVFGARILLLYTLKARSFWWI